MNGSTGPKSCQADDISFANRQEELPCTEHEGAVHWATEVLVATWRFTPDFINSTRATAKDGKSEMGINGRDRSPRMLWFVCLATILGISVPELTPSRAEETAAPPRYLERLRTQYRKLQSLESELDGLSESLHRPRVKIADAGSRLLREGIALRETLEALRNSEAPQESKEELQLVGAAVDLLHDLLCKYRLLAGLELSRLTAQQKRQVRNNVELLVGDVAQGKVAARLQAEGLRDLLDRDGWDEACGRTALHVKRKVQEWVRLQLEQISRKPLYDIASATTVLGEGVHRQVARRLEALAVKITSDELSIIVGGRGVVQFDGEALKRFLAGQGRAESRARHVTAAAGKAGRTLESLPKDGAPDNVWARLRRAEGALAALRSLLADLQRSNDNGLCRGLTAAAGRLEASVRSARRRFPLRSPEIIEELDRKASLLAETLSGIRKLGVVKKPPAMRAAPSEGQTRKWYLTHKYQIPTEWVERRGPRAAVARTSSVSIAPELGYIDLDKLRQRREYLRNEGRADGKVDPRRYAARYRADYVVRVTCNGQTRHVYYTFGNRPRRFGTDHCHGLTDGHHTAVVTVVTRDGFRLDDTFTIAVELNRRKGVERRRQAAEVSRRRMSKSTDKARANYAHNHIIALLAHGNELTVAATVMPEDLLAIAQECADTLGFILIRKAQADRQKQDYFNAARAIVKFCGKISDQGAYHLAWNVARGAETAANTREEKSQVAEMYQAVAHLAIGGSNDASAAKAHLEKWLELREASGYFYTDAQQAAERETWPTKIECGD